MQRKGWLYPTVLPTVVGMFKAAKKNPTPATEPAQRRAPRDAPTQETPRAVRHCQKKAKRKNRISVF